jgi:hypothetical protein
MWLKCKALSSISTTPKIKQVKDKYNNFLNKRKMILDWKSGMHEEIKSNEKAKYVIKSEGLLNE